MIFLDILDDHDEDLWAEQNSIIFSDIFEYTHALNRMSVCGLRVWKVGNKYVVIATELDSNTGPSITNSVESLAAAVCKKFSLDPQYVTWVEHYPEDRSLGKDLMDEHFDLVTFSHYSLKNDEWVFFGPDWRRVSAEEVEKLIGERT